MLRRRLRSSLTSFNENQQKARSDPVVCEPRVRDKNESRMLPSSIPLWSVGTSGNLCSSSAGNTPTHWEGLRLCICSIFSYSLYYMESSYQPLIDKHFVRPSLPSQEEIVPLASIRSFIPSFPALMGGRTHRSDSQSLLVPQSYSPRLLAYHTWPSNRTLGAAFRFCS